MRERNRGLTTDLIVSFESCAKRAKLCQKVGYNIRTIPSHAPLQNDWTELWAEIKRDVHEILRQGSLNIDLFIKNFKSLGLTADPRVFFRFVPMHDSLWMNVWGVMYHPPFEIASTLVHEKEHRTFCSEKVIGASYDELAKFGKLYGKESEIRAHEKEVAFLKLVRNSIDRTWIVILPTSAQIAYDFDNRITDQEKQLDALKSSATSSGQEYQVASTAKASQDLLKIMRFLNANLHGLNGILKTQPEPIVWETEF